MSDILASLIADNFFKVNFISIFNDYFHNISHLTVIINLYLPFFVCFKQT